MDWKGFSEGNFIQFHNCLLRAEGVQSPAPEKPRNKIPARTLFSRRIRSQDDEKGAEHGQDQAGWTILLTTRPAERMLPRGESLAVRWRELLRGTRMCKGSAKAKICGGQFLNPRDPGPDARLSRSHKQSSVGEGMTWSLRG